jgi:hypothetical protein
MTHVDLDAQPENVRHFLLSLPVPPEGTLLEAGGRAVAFLIPPPRSTNGMADTDEEWTDAKNQRRCDLIDRKYDTGLTAPEEAELAVLQAAMYRHVDRVSPLPIDATRLLHQQILEKAMKTHLGSEA